jgi:hypothetical protein
MKELEYFIFSFHLLKRSSHIGNDSTPVMDFEKAYDSGRRELLYSILSEYIRPIRLFRLINMFSPCGDRGIRIVPP